MANQHNDSAEFKCQETPEELERLLKKENVSYRFKRLQALWLLCRGQETKEVRDTVGIGAGTLRNWQKWYEQGGLDELLNDHIPPGSKGLTYAVHKNLYEVARYLRFSTQEKVGLLVEVPVCVQDPWVVAQYQDLAETIKVKWEPGLNDGPTSARFAVVDYNADTGKLIEPVRWNNERRYFQDSRGKAITKVDLNDFQFHQVNVWGIVQRVLEFYEAPWSQGRPVPWGFEGNRLIVVPHAGYGENAYYDRHSKSLQFYYYGQAEEPKFTCLSHDIVAHELGHAILDGIRPYYYESTSLETTAFHEFIADFTAILSALRNNDVREVLINETEGRLSEPNFIANLAEEFGEYVEGRNYLRSANNQETMKSVFESSSPHFWSQVLTGAMFKIFVKIYEDWAKQKGQTGKMPIWNATKDIIGIALQPVDYLPPADVRFEDYAAAVLHVQQMKDPADADDPEGIYAFMRKEFYEVRGIAEKFMERPQRRYQYVYHDVESISGSRTAAYYYLDDNRSSFRIPVGQDFVVADLYDSNKFAPDASRLPREIILEYVWREEIDLNEYRFGRLQGKTTSLICGGTLVFDERGNILSWCRKPGTQVVEDEDEGQTRKQQLLSHIENRIRQGVIGLAEDEMDLLGPWTRPVTALSVDGSLRFEVAPHLRDDDPAEVGEESWQMDY